MNQILLKLVTFLTILFSQSNEIPNLNMTVGKEDFGTEEEETCFGCGDCSVYCAIENEFTISSSSNLKAQGKINYYGKNINDYNLKSAWIEGKKGYGIGEWIEFSFDNANVSNSNVELNGLFLFNGYRKNLTSWKENSRIKQMKIIVNRKDFAFLNLSDSYKIQSTPIPSLKLKDLTSIRFEIIDIYKGDKWKDVALSELRFMGIHHH